MADESLNCSRPSLAYDHDLVSPKSSEQPRTANTIVQVASDLCTRPLDLVLGKSSCQISHARQYTMFAASALATLHHKHQRRRRQLLYGQGYQLPPKHAPANEGWLENLSDLRHESMVWRPCWISGGYRLEAASGPIALYIVGIREAQGRNQHFMSGTGTWSSGFWFGDGGLSWQIRTG
jgi:hypothetical protein